MPIRYVDKVGRLGLISSQLDGVTALLQGTRTVPAGRTGVILAQLSGVTALIQGQSFGSINRTGVIGSTLAGVTAQFNGTFVPAGIPFASVRTFNTGNLNGDVDRIKILADSTRALGSFWATGEGTLELFFMPLSGNNAATVATGAGQYTWIWGNIIVDRDRYDQLPGWGLSLTDGRVTFGLKTSAGQYTARGTSDVRLRTTEPTHIAVQRNATSGRIRVWVNYALEVDVTGPTGSLAYPSGATPLNSCGPAANQSCSFSDPYIVIGAEKHNAVAGGVNGITTELRFSSIARYNGSSITPLTGRFTNDANTVGLYPMQEQSGNQVLDISSNANHGTLMVGGPNNGPQRSTVAPVYASGALTHGDIVTITGSGFGTHPLTQAFIGGSTGIIEATAVNAQPSNGSGWDFVPSGVRAPKLGFDDSVRRRVLTSTYGTGGAPNMPVAFDTGSGVPLGGRVYISGWVFTTFNQLAAGAQWKIVRFRLDNGITDDAPDFLLNYFGQHTFSPNPGASQTALYDNGGTSVGANAWYRIEIEIEFPATQNSPTGIARVRIHNGSTVPANKTFSHSSGANNSNINFYPNATRSRWLVWQHYFGNPVSGALSGVVRQDDHYCQVGTHKRIELCNNANYAASTIREIQPPTAWADGAVSFRLNEGGLLSGTYWAHVVGENNTSLGSRQVILGAS